MLSEDPFHLGSGSCLQSIRSVIEESPPGLNLGARANGGVFGILRLGSGPCTPGISQCGFRRSIGALGWQHGLLGVAGDQ